MSAEKKEIIVITTSTYFVIRTTTHNMYSIVAHSIELLSSRVN